MPILPPRPLPPTGPRRGDLIFLDTGVDMAPPRAAGPPIRSKEAPRHTPEPPRPPKTAAPPPVRESEPEPEPEAESEPVAPEGLIRNESLVPPSEMIDDLIIDPLVTESSPGESDSLLGLQQGADSLLGGNIDLDAPLEIQRQETDFGSENSLLDGVQGSGYDFTPDLGAGGLDVPDGLLSMSESDAMLDLPPDLQALDPPAVPDADFDAGLDTESVDLTGGLPLIRSEHEGPLTLADLEERVLDDPENPDVHLQMAEGLMEAGEEGRVSRSWSWRWRATKTARIGCGRRRWPIGWLRSPRTASAITRSESSWPTGPGIGRPRWRPSRPGRCSSQVGCTGQGNRGVREGHRAHPKHVRPRPPGATRRHAGGKEQVPGEDLRRSPPRPRRAGGSSPPAAKAPPAPSRPRQRPPNPPLRLPNPCSSARGRRPRPPAGSRPARTRPGQPPGDPRRRPAGIARFGVHDLRGGEAPG